MPTTLLTPRAPLSAVSGTIPRVDSPVRLALTPLPGPRDVVDGTWWPYSRDATTQLPGLIAAVDQRRGRTTLRVGVHPEAWEHIPRRVPARGRQVDVRLFHHAHVELVVLCFAGGEHLALHVVPPGTANRATDRATDGVADSATNSAADSAADATDSAAGRTTRPAPPPVLTAAHPWPGPPDARTSPRRPRPCGG